MSLRTSERIAAAGTAGTTFAAVVSPSSGPSGARGRPTSPTARVGRPSTSPTPTVVRSPAGTTAGSAATNRALAEMTAKLEAFQTKFDAQDKAVKDAAKVTSSKMAALEAENEALQVSLEELQASSPKGKKKEKKDDRRFLPTVSDSPYFPLPRSHTSFKPFLAPLKGEETADLLRGEALEEYRTLHWSLKSLHDCLSHFRAHADEWLEATESQVAPADPQKAAAYLEALFNTLDETTQLLLHRFQIIRTREHLKSAHGALTVGDEALLDYIQTELYGVHPGQHVVDPKIKGLLEAFGQKVLYSKLAAGAKADAGAVPGGKLEAKTAKQQRKDRLAREAAAKARKALLAADHE